MTDRHSAYIVVLERNMRSDDAEPTIAALRQIRGVLTVEPVVANTMDFVAEERVRSDLAKKLFAVLYPKERT